MDQWEHAHTNCAVQETVIQLLTTALTITTATLTHSVTHNKLA